jgi:hydrogenase maturation protease
MATGHQPDVIVVGIGNPDRGDDRAGRAVADRLAGRLPADVAVVQETGEATALLARLRSAKAAFLVDACASGAAVGTIQRLDAGAAPLPQGLFGMSTHGFGLAEAIELARTLGELPPHCIVYAIEGGTFDLGAPLSPPVASAVADVAERLCADVAALQPAEA